MVLTKKKDFMKNNGVTQSWIVIKRIKPWERSKLWKRKKITEIKHK